MQRQETTRSSRRRLSCLILYKLTNCIRLLSEQSKRKQHTKDAQRSCGKNCKRHRKSVPEGNPPCCTQVALSVVCNRRIPGRMWLEYPLQYFRKKREAKTTNEIAFNWAHLLFELSHEENSIRMAEKTALEVPAVGG